MLRSLLLLCFMTSVAPAAPCPEIADSILLSQHLQLAEKAYIGLDVPTFTRSMDEAALLLPCLSDLIEPSLAAWYHRVLGIRLFVGRETEVDVESLAAARGLRPDYTFPSELVPEGHPIRTRYDEVNPQSFREVPAGIPTEVTLVFDGTKAVKRPYERASIVQIVSPGGDVLSTSYLFSNDPMPPFDMKRPPPPPGVVRFQPNRPMLFTASVATALWVATYVPAQVSANRFTSGKTPFDSLEKLEAGYRRTNTLATISWFPAGVAVLSGVGAVAFGEF